MFSKKIGIGNTPMIKLFYRLYGKEKYVYIKLEYYNLTGSIKDRVAYYIINNAMQDGRLKNGMPIIEATSGNTGIALACIGKYYKHKVHIFMPDWASSERISIMRSFGADVYLVSKEEGGFKRCLEEARNMAIRKNSFLANQFANIDNYLAHYETTAEEIIEQVPEDITVFVSGVGTGGTLMGTGKRLKEQFKDFKIIAIEPDKMPLISQNKIISNHKIEGIGDDFIPDLLDKSMLDNVFLVNDDDAINMSRRLAKDLGLGVGISSGANLIGCILAQENGPMATVFADDNKKYLSTELAKDVVYNKSFISNKVELLGYVFV